MVRNKSGISLIVLVITIIIMIILAGAVIVSLSSSDIVDRANETVETTNLRQVQELASMAWGTAYIDKMSDDSVDLYTRVIEALENNGIDVSKYNVVVDAGGVTVSKRDGSTSEPIITLDKTNITEGIIQGSTKVVTLTATVENISGTLTWSSNNEAVAEVTGNGATAAVTLKSAGTATITVTDGNVSATCNVEVTLLESTLTLSPTSITESIIKGSTKVVTITATAQNVGTLSWSSNNPTVAEVVGNGTSATVTLKAGGTATITVTDGNTSATCSISVTELVPSLSVSPTSITESITQGSTKVATITATAQNVGTLSWSSNNPTVAEVVGNGTTATVTLKAEGTATITVTDGNVSATCSVTVTEETAKWTLQKTVTDGKVTEVKVTNGTETYDVGTVINYMPNGVGPTTYTGGWKILGVDEEGRLLIMSSASITGSNVTLGGSTLAAATQSYLDALTTLQTAVDGYKDGTIGVAVRSVKVEDIDALTSFEKTTYGEGNIYAYGNEVKYTWDGDEYPSYSYGTTPTTGNLSRLHSSGFTYYDAASGEIVTSAYTTTADTEITTLKSDYYNYTGSTYLDSTTKAYKMIFRNAADTGNADTYWLASRYVYASSGHAAFGVRIVNSGGVSGFSFFFSHGLTYGPSYAARAVVTLASGVQLTESTTTAGTYDVSLAE